MKDYYNFDLTLFLPSIVILKPELTAHYDL